MRGMASFRRSLSTAIHDRPLPNGSAFPVSPAVNRSQTTAVASNLGSLFPVDLTESVFTFGVLRCPLSRLRNCQRQGSAYERSKTKGHIWKKPFLHVIFCFFLGFLTGLTPFNWPTLTPFAHEERQEFALELKNFPTNVQREVSNDGGRERQLETLKADVTARAQIRSVNNKSAKSSMHGREFGAFVGSEIPEFALRKLLIVVTPTYNRPFQALYLTRMSHTLKLVPPPLLWLVIEMHAQTMETAAILRRTGVMYRHLVCDKNITVIKDRGVHQRNTGLAHIEQHQLDGIVYFADDDNVYTLQLFEQMRRIKRFGTWPVGMLAHSKAKAILEGPVCDGDMVIGWHTNEKSKRLRRFHVDMSGFAFNSTILWDPQRWRRPTLEPVRQLDTVKEGFQETTFIEQVVEDESQMEGLPNGCSKVMVWHLHLESPNLVYPPGWILKGSLNATVLVQ
eukprot:c24102_g1_i1 orf=289-1641(-)